MAEDGMKKVDSRTECPLISFEPKAKDLDLS